MGHDLARLTDGIAASLRQFHVSSTRCDEERHRKPVDSTESEDRSPSDRAGVRYTSKNFSLAAKKQLSRAASSEIQGLPINRPTKTPSTPGRSPRAGSDGPSIDLRGMNAGKAPNATISRVLSSPIRRGNLVGGTQLRLSRDQGQGRTSTGVRVAQSIPDGRADRRPPVGRGGTRGRAARGGARGGRRGGAARRGAAGGEFDVEEDDKSDDRDLSKAWPDGLLKVVLEEYEQSRPKEVQFNPSIANKEELLGLGGATAATPAGAQDLLEERFRLLADRKDMTAFSARHRLAGRLLSGKLVRFRDAEEKEAVLSMANEMAKHGPAIDITFAPLADLDPTVRDPLVGSLVGGAYELSDVSGGNKEARTMASVAQHLDKNGTYLGKDRDRLMNVVRGLLPTSRPAPSNTARK
ncbi:hypothetical protein W97_03458 [Coniosporium apollinis CBS 100218]|uniref:Uncharacterized protein n=1 Tax=Coniosporium apollinis (strain CBS 100218) TaxID=1168221 RepID=R7YQU9_CONA1|nr:uncharacterized protein W97_03458 [Coniosporium apollinis CBS 100218]EON64228.1 hypothetical protein W97_03458 [Coniosporium apollinis CBS 100218]